MRTARSTGEIDPRATHIQGSMCPYSRATSIFCSASVMTVAINIHRKATYCCTDDFDRCPLFLAKILRGE